MKITIVQGAFLPVPPLAGGAVEKLWFELGSELSRRGLDVTHVSRRWHDLPDRDVIGGVQHRRVAGFDYPRSRLLAKLRDLVYSARCLTVLDRADVIVTNTFFLPLLLSLLPKRGAIYVSVHRYPQGQMALYRGVDRLQCVSTAVGDAVKAQAPVVAHLVKIVPNYVSIQATEAQVGANWERRRREVLFVGRVHPEKGLDLLIDAFAALDVSTRASWRLKVVGPHETRAGGGGQDYLDQLKARADSSGIAVDWVGAIYDRDALNACYQTASVFVYPSIAALGEAFPLAPLEAMAQGCPVITSDLKCFDDFLHPAVNGDVFPLDSPDRSNALRVVLQALIDDPARRRVQAFAALRSSSRFSLARIADRLVEDFSELSKS